MSNCDSMTRFLVISWRKRRRRRENREKRNRRWRERAKGEGREGKDIPVLKSRQEDPATPPLQQCTVQRAWATDSCVPRGPSFKRCYVTPRSSLQWGVRSLDRRVTSTNPIARAAIHTPDSNTSSCINVTRERSGYKRDRRICFGKRTDLEWRVETYRDILSMATKNAAIREKCREINASGDWNVRLKECKNMK